MTDEQEAMEQQTFEQEQQEEPRRRSGPGFVLGVLFGALAGAAAATLFAPAPGEEIRHRISEEAAPLLKEGEGEGAGLKGRVRTLAARVRERVQVARQEAHEARQAAEQEAQARYEELTGQGPNPSL